MSAERDPFAEVDGMIEISVAYQLESARIGLSGRVDGGRACDFVKMNVQAALDVGYTHLEFDLSDVEWISSRGLGCLVLIHQFLRERGGTVSLLSPNPRVTRTLEATGLRHAIPELAEARRASVRAVR